MGGILSAFLSLRNLQTQVSLYSVGTGYGAPIVINVPSSSDASKPFQCGIYVQCQSDTVDVTRGILIDNVGISDSIYTNLHSTVNGSGGAGYAVDVQNAGATGFIALTTVAGGRACYLKANDSIDVTRGMLAIDVGASAAGVGITIAIGASATAVPISISNGGTGKSLVIQDGSSVEKFSVSQAGNVVTQGTLTQVGASTFQAGITVNNNIDLKWKNSGGTGVNVLKLGSNNNILIGEDSSALPNVAIGHLAALATNATTGFLYIPTSAGAPIATPTSLAGKVAMEYDTTNNKLYVYNGAWVSVTLA